MPSHIFTRVGSWTESVATNERSAAAARRSNDYDEATHAMDYMVYAYLQLGRDADARRVVDEISQVPGRSNRFSGPYALAAMPARYAIERGDWKTATALEPRPNNLLFTEPLTHFARGLGSARSGDVAGAEKSAQELARLRDALKAAKNDYWATEAEVSRLGVTAWTALAQGKRDDALTLMRSAADIEDKNEKHIVTPGRILPARELLGQMLLELKRPADALKEFELSHAREPDRFAGLYGAAQAAALSGDKAKAKRHYARLVEVASQSTRAEVATARAFLAANP